ncbi:hypothetical protein JR316_0005137 [Psilocybe cubensis]|uniref:Uncharacterized protein n=1 Tax=Psilocybe cubensis TaxID=181762 RepID=A0ACB8H5Q8_PSICU|nr:hypothetical protein JR316_0005137 [Psilocybe cubensis]KAH9483037.1 hypothetical protein JR316_0005137 [Psilocybe cubensis]
MSSTNLKFVNIPKLLKDRSNWITYKAQMVNHFAAKRLTRHLNGSTRKPKIPWPEKDSQYFIRKSTIATTEEQLEKYKVELDLYKQKQAQAREAIYKTVSCFVFLEIKGKAMTALVWQKLTTMHEKKGIMMYTNTLAKLVASQYVKDSNMHIHITAYNKESK